MTATAHAPATSDDLAAELLRRRRRRLPVLTATLALVVAIAAGIVGGVEIQKHRGSGTTAAGTARSAFASRFAASGATGRGGFGGFGGAAGFGGGGSTTSGTVTLIKGSTLYVTDASGNTVLVHTKPTSRVTKTETGTLKTVHPGDTVTVAGTAASNGSVTATSISIGSAATNG